MGYNVLDVCRHIINYSNDKTFGITNLKLQKILYFTQAYFLLAKHEVCFNDRIEAWNFGPVVPAAYREYKMFGSSNIPRITYFIEKEKNIWDSKVKPYFDDVMSDDDKGLSEIVVDKFADYSAADLVKITHRQKPWIDAYVPNRNNEIKPAAIEEYFNA